MITKNNILNEKVSFQKNAYAKLSQELTIKEVLKGIKDKRLESKISHLRNLISTGELESYNQYKKNLPGVTFSGTFEKSRKRNNLNTYNQIIVIDIDKLSNDELTRIKDVLKKEPYVISYWESPSKKGLKGLVYLSFENEIDDIDKFHRIAFKKLVKYFLSNYQIELDESGSDTTRLCFISSDHDIIIKDKICYFPISKNDINEYSKSVKKSPEKKTKIVRRVNKKDALFNSTGKNKPLDRKTIKSITIYLKKRNLSITNTYDKWYKIAFAISNSFTYEIGERYFLDLSKQDKTKYDEIECKNLLIDCYETTNNKISFNTIFYHAQKCGYKI